MPWSFDVAQQTNAANAESFVAPDSLSGLPIPGGSGHLNRLSFRQVHFDAVQLSVALDLAAGFLRRLEEEAGRPPYVLCIHGSLIWTYSGTPMRRVTLVLGNPDDQH